MSYDRSKSKHECAVPGCGLTIPANLLMCLPHWKRVPADLRRAVSDSYRISMGDYLVAREAAIQSVAGGQS